MHCLRTSPAESYKWPDDIVGQTCWWGMEQFGDFCWFVFIFVLVFVFVFDRMIWGGRLGGEWNNLGTVLHSKSNWAPLGECGYKAGVVLLNIPNQLNMVKYYGQFCKGKCQEVPTASFHPALGQLLMQVYCCSTDPHLPSILCWYSNINATICIWMWKRTFGCCQGYQSKMVKLVVKIEDPWVPLVTLTLTPML